MSTSRCNVLTTGILITTGTNSLPGVINTYLYSVSLTYDDIQLQKSILVQTTKKWNRQTEIIYSPMFVRDEFLWIEIVCSLSQISKENRNNVNYTIIEREKYNINVILTSNFHFWSSVFMLVWTTIFTDWFTSIHDEWKHMYRYYLSNKWRIKAYA